MFDNTNSQNRERNLPKTRFYSTQNALFGEKARPRTTNKACLHSKRNLFRLQKSLDYTTNKACFPHYSHDPRRDTSAKQYGNHSKPAHYPNPPIFRQDLPRHRFLPDTDILSNQKPTFQSKYKTRKIPKKPYVQHRTHAFWKPKRDERQDRLRKHPSAASKQKLSEVRLRRKLKEDNGQ